MLINKDDPRLTAYALGELAGDEFFAVEAAVEADPELRQEVEAIREMAGLLAESLRNEPLAEAARVKPAAKRSVLRIALYSATGLAAAVAMALYLAPEPKPYRFENIELTTTVEYPADGTDGGSARPLAEGARRPGEAQSGAERAGGEKGKEGGEVAEIPVETAVKESVDVSAGVEPAKDGDSSAQVKKTTEALRQEAVAARGYVRADADKLEVASTSPNGRATVKIGGDMRIRYELGFDGSGANPPAPTSAPLSKTSTDSNAVSRKIVDHYGDMPSNVVGSQPNVRRFSEAELTQMGLTQEDLLDAKVMPRAVDNHPIPAIEDIRQRIANRTTEAYDKIVENEFQRVSEHPLSTFSIDVDTASYSNMRRMLNQGALPPAGAVRIEELVNYFDYDYRTPTDGRPFATHFEAVKCPWAPEHTLLRVGLKGKVIAADERPHGNFVFLLDVSGSMTDANKLGLVKEGMKLLVNQLNAHDRVAIVVYAGASGLVLPSTSCADKHKIIEALDRLEAGGSTNGGAGIQLAYATAAANFIENGINRVILCTDGDFNVGTTDQSSLIDLIEKKAKEKVFLTVLGFGMGNYKDSTLEKLADKGNGNYGYIDTLNEAKKMLVEQLSGTLVTIAKDVKIQIEFNPQAVQAYRLIGYENRKLNKEDFNDDKKDAGEIGAGHTVTALYEIVPAGVEMKLDTPQVDPLKYQKSAPAVDETAEMLTLKLRYKEPAEDTSKLLEFPVRNAVAEWEKADDNTRFAASVAAFGMLLRGSQFSGSADFDKVVEWASNAKGSDNFGYRAEFVNLVRAAKSLKNR